MKKSSRWSHLLLFALCGLVVGLACNLPLSDYEDDSVKWHTVCGENEVILSAEGFACRPGEGGKNIVTYDITMKNIGEGYAHDVEYNVEKFVTYNADGEAGPGHELSGNEGCKFTVPILGPGEAKDFACEVSMWGCPSATWAERKCDYLSEESHNRLTGQSGEDGEDVVHDAAEVDKLFGGDDGLADEIEDIMSQLGTGVATYKCSTERFGWDESECANAYDIEVSVVIDLDTMTFSYYYTHTCSKPTKSLFGVCNMNTTFFEEDTGSGTVYEDGWLLGSHDVYRLHSWEYLDCDRGPGSKEGDWPDVGLVARPSEDFSTLHLGFHRIDWLLPIKNLRSNNIQTIEGINQKWDGFIHKMIECSLAGGS
jgi:hypothetical protein